MSTCLRRAGVPALIIAAVIGLSACTADEPAPHKSSNPDPNQAETAQSQPSNDDEGKLPPAVDGTMPPAVVDELDDDGLIAARQALGCLYGYEAAEVEQPVDTYAKCEAIMSDEFAGYLSTFDLGDPITPPNLPWQEMTVEGDATAEMTVTTSDDGGEVGEGEYDDIVYPSFDVSLEFESGSAAIDFGVSIALTRDSKNDHWLVDDVQTDNPDSSPADEIL